MAALLLVIRDALDPLGSHTPDPVRRFLGEVVDKLRRQPATREAAGGPERR